MLQYVYYILIYLFNYQFDGNVIERNELKNNITKNYKAKNYKEVANDFEKLKLISFNIEPEVNLNAAHANYKINNITTAKKIYLNLQKQKSSELKSICGNQLALISCLQKDTSQAIIYLKNAIELNVANIQARYNYEFLNRKFKQKRQPNKTNSPQNTKSGKSINSNEKIDDLESNSKSEITKEKALQLLDELKTQEIKKYNFNKSKNNSKKTEQDW